MSEIEVTVTGTGPTPRGLGPGDRWRAATAMGALLVRRRAWRDRGLVLASALLVLASTLLSVVAPRLVLDVVDRGVVDVLEGLDDRAEIIVRANVGNSGSAVPGLRGELFDQFARAATEIDEHLPALASVAMIRSPSMSEEGFKIRSATYPR